uniref:Uncharacterized protein n=1 Tax=Fusarium oxysporum (strain Fo5176) TaxID=660025 RepID=A0A0D2YHX0_FUSOF
MLHINDIWDRTEKVLYLLMDLALNSAFLHKVKRELIADGLIKYKLLFNFNVSVVVISLSMDILIIVMMSLPNPFLYAVFHPVAYSVKLIIEIMMADLIAKIVRSQNELNSYQSAANTNSTRVPELRRWDHTANGSEICKAEASTAHLPGAAQANNSMFCSLIEAIPGLGDSYAPAVLLVQEQRRIGYRAPRYLRVQRLEGIGGRGG